MYRHNAKFVLLFLGLATSAGSAFGGVLGANSRGTVSISITVPPHVMVSPGKFSRTNESDLCVASNGVHDYSLMLLGADGGAAEPIGLSSPGSGCSGSEAAVEMSKVGLSDELAHSSQRTGEPLTVLVVPN